MARIRISRPLLTEEPKLWEVEVLVVFSQTLAPLSIEMS